MGSWQLEVFRMGLYIMFPVAMFHYFNHPEVNEKWLAKNNAERYDLEQEKQTKILKEFIEDYKQRTEMERLKAMEEKFNQTNVRM